MSFADNDQDQKDQQTAQGNNTGDDAGKTEPFFVDGDRVFQTKEDLIKSWSAGQEHINKLESEAAQRAQAEQAAEQDEQKGILKELLETVKSNTGRKADETSQSSKPEFNEEEIVTKAVTKLLDTLSEKELEGNMETCMEKAEEVLGDDYKKTIQAKAKELGMSMDSVDNLAKTSPGAFNKLFLPSASNTSTGFASGSTMNGKGSPLDNDGQRKGNYSLAGKTSADQAKTIIDLGTELGLYK